MEQAAARSSSRTADAAERERWARHAANVTIARDDWGVAHIHGRSDADAVFGMIYAQAEDDFPRVEANYLAALGRSAEAEGAGETALWSDLRARLFVEPGDLSHLVDAAPGWLRALMQAWADGLNCYLAAHPDERPQVLQRFEPSMCLAFTEGANGADIARISLADLAAFYEAPEATRIAEAAGAQLAEPPGSNGIALAPAMTRDGKALLLINPHTTFYLRSELQVSSDEGLNAYGAVTWGQFFVYQGFNAHMGWMHTTSSADCVDEFAETIVVHDGGLAYRYGGELRPVQTERVELRARAPDGALQTRTFTVFRTHHGPVVRAADGRWITVALMQRPMAALEQAFLRTKAQDVGAFIEVSRRAANSTNNTVLADAHGAIALLSPQFVPRRDDRFDYTRPVEGADPASDWQGDTPDSELPNLINPPNGWLYNANDGPWWAAGAASPARGDFPRYMDQIGANTRTAHALAILEHWRDFTPERLRDAAFDTRLPVFDTLLPDLFAAFDSLPSDDARRAALAAPVAVLRDWDRRSSLSCVATTLATAWGERLRGRVAADIRPGRLPAVDRMLRASAAEKLDALSGAVDELVAEHGRWEVAWGDLNRFQRIDPAPAPRFSDDAPSWPVPFAASQWGALTAYTASRQAGTTKAYGVSGNAFVAVVEFGPKVRALAVGPGGASGRAGSPHFADQSARFAAGDLREVYFHPEDLAGHVERRYSPDAGQAPPSAL